MGGGGDITSGDIFRIGSDSKLKWSMNVLVDFNKLMLKNKKGWFCLQM